MMPNNSTGTLKPNAPGINTVNVRHTENGALKTSLPIGTQVSVIQKSASPDANGFKWFKISFGSGNDGWVRSDLIDIPNPPAIPTPNPPPQVPTDKNTMLFFETDPTTIRVFQGSNRLYMNIFDKASNTAQQVGAIRLSESKDANGLLWQSYVAEYDQKSFAARFIPLSDPSSKAELVVSNAINGSLISRESGYKIDGTAYRERL